MRALTILLIGVVAAPACQMATAGPDAGQDVPGGRTDAVDGRDTRSDPGPTDAPGDGDLSPPPAGPTLGGEAPPAEATVGEFLVRWTPDEPAGPSFTVVHSAGPTRELLANVSGQSFIHAGRGEEQVQSASGSFRFDDQVLERCDRQTVDSLQEGGDAARPTLTVTGRLSGDGCGDQGAGERPYQLVFSGGSAGANLELELSAGGSRPGDTNRLWLVLAAGASERFYGLGVQYSFVDLKGQRVPLSVTEQGIGRGLEPLSTAVNAVAPGSAGDALTTYAPMPVWHTSAGRGAALLGAAHAVLDLSPTDHLELGVFADRLDLQLLPGGQPLELIEQLTRVTGRMPALPAWTQTGAIPRVHGGSAEVRRLVDVYQQAGVPLAGVWIEDWVGTRETALGTRLRWNWEPDPTFYADWDQLLADLAARGIRVLVYVNPYLVDVAGEPGVSRNLYAEALELDLLKRDPAGEVISLDQGGFAAGIVDLFEPRAQAFLKQVLADQLARGVSGWMADFGEAYPYDAAAPDEQARNRYPEAWARLNREVLEESGRLGDAVFFTRSGFTRSPGLSTLFWLGDQLVTWDAFDGLGTVVRGLLSAGLSGIALDHPDVGGYLSLALGKLTVERSPELLLRWMELAAFTPLLRTHETNRPDDNVQVTSSPELLAAFARATTLFAALAPYRQTLMAEATARGIPLVRHLHLHHPDDPVAGSVDDQFLLGPDVLVAPVLGPGETQRRVYLPAGRWTHLWSGTAHDQAEGGHVTVDAPTGEPPVFYVTGSAAGKLLTAALP